MSAVGKIAPWTAKPLSDAAKTAKFRAVMDLAAERVILGRSAIVTGWAIGGVGVACFAASIFGWVTLLPLKTSEVKFFLVDKSTGIIGEPVGLKDAPRLFGAAVEQQYLKRYIEAREVRPAIPAVCPGGALRRSAAHSAGEIAKNDPNGMAGACALLSGGLRQHQRHGVADGSPGRPDLGAVA